MDGSLNPIHKQHIENFEVAKRGIEKKNSDVKVVAGYISPSTDIYVKDKLGEEAISGNYRIEMVKLATEDSP
jgi:nicotinic acid mononucleotide adenylyltransferase